MLKKITFFMISICFIFSLLGCTLNRNYYGLSIPLGVFETEPFAELPEGYEATPYEYARIKISVISKDEYNASKGINVVADKVYPNKIEKYCYIELYGYDKEAEALIKLNIINMERYLGSPNCYYGKVFLEDKYKTIGSFELRLNILCISLLNHHAEYHIIEQ